MLRAMGTDWCEHGRGDKATTQPSSLEWIAELSRRLDRAGVAYHVERAPYGRKYDRWIVASESDIRLQAAREHAEWEHRHAIESARYDEQSRAAQAAQAAQGPIELDW